MHNMLSGMEELDLKKKIQDQYQPEHLHYDNDLLNVIHDLNPEVVYCVNEEQAEYLEDLDRSINVDTESLVEAITYCRSIKTEWELDQMRKLRTN
jgi:Xaa-Pro dipeptidase